MASKQRPDGYWQNLENRINETKGLVFKTGKTPQEITTKDFQEHGLSGILSACGASPYAALKEAGLVKFEPWEMKNGTPQGYWKEKDNRVMATKWLVDKTEKEPKNITHEDFIKNGLGGLLMSSVYHNSHYLALKEAGYLIKENVYRIWKKFEDRINAIRELVKESGKDPKEITCSDFKNNGLGGLLYQHYKNSPYAALKEAVLVHFEPWEMKTVPRGFWQDKKNLVSAVKWLIAKSGKEPQEINYRDFKEYGLTRLLRRTESILTLLKEAGYDVNEKPKPIMPAELLKLYIKK